MYLVGASGMGYDLIARRLDAVFEGYGWDTRNPFLDIIDRLSLVPGHPPVWLGQANFPKGTIRFPWLFNVEPDNSV